MKHSFWILLGALLSATGCLAPGGDGVFGFVSSNPADGSNRFPLSQTLHVRLSGRAVAEESLQHIELRLLNADLVYPTLVDVSYNSLNHSIDIDPAQPLAAGGRYVLSLPGITSIDGIVLPDRTISFETVVNPPAFTWNFDPDGNPIAFARNINDDRGRLTRFEVYFDPGADGDYGTDDDLLSSLDTTGYSEDDLTAYHVAYSGPGPDGDWDTYDDNAINFFNEQLYDPIGRSAGYVNYSDAGADGEPFTDDDTILGYGTNGYEENTFEHIDYGAPGTDATWFTDDDVVAARTADTREGPTVTHRFSTAAGPDGEFGTNDDDGGIGIFEVTPHGTRTSMMFYTAGPDGLFFTGDDEPDGHAEIHLGEGEQIVARDYYDASDTQTNRDELTHRADGSITKIVLFTGAGTDGTWNTDDDDIATYITTDFDERGSRLTQRTFFDPGDDGIWFTEDDTPAQVLEFDPTR